MTLGHRNPAGSGAQHESEASLDLLHSTSPSSGPDRFLMTNNGSTKNHVCLLGKNAGYLAPGVAPGAVRMVELVR